MAEEPEAERLDATGGRRGRAGKVLSRAPRRSPLGAHQERRRAGRGDARLPDRRQLRRRDSQAPAGTRPGSPIPAPTRSSPSSSAPTSSASFPSPPSSRHRLNLGTNRFVAVRVEPATIGTNQVLAWQRGQLTPRWPNRPSSSMSDLINLSPASGFFVAFQVAFYGGMVLASPFIFYFVASFVFPALKMKEKHYVYRGLGFGVGLVPLRRRFLLFRPHADGAGRLPGILRIGSAFPPFNGRPTITSALSANSCSAWGWALKCRWSS